MDAYYQQLNTLLKHIGTGMPQLIVDVAALNHNLVITQQQIPHSLHPRLVVKSLACGIASTLCYTAQDTALHAVSFCTSKNTFRVDAAS